MLIQFFLKYNSIIAFFLSIQSYGPIIIDATPPTFTGSRIDLKFEDSTLIANWSRTAFTDYEDPYPLHYQFALGNI